MAMRSSGLRLPVAVARASCKGSKLHVRSCIFRCLDEKRIEWKGVCTKDVRRVFEESFDVVHGDEGSG